MPLPVEPTAEEKRNWLIRIQQRPTFATKYDVEHAERFGYPEIAEMIRQIILTGGTDKAAQQTFLNKLGPLLDLALEDLGGPAEPDETEPFQPPPQPPTPVQPPKQKADDSDGDNVGGGLDQQYLDIAAGDLAHRMELARQQIAASLLEEMIDVQRDSYSIVPAMQLYAAAGGSPLASTLGAAMTGGVGQPSPYGEAADQLIKGLMSFATGGPPPAPGAPLPGEEGDYPPGEEPPYEVPGGNIPPPEVLDPVTGQPIPSDYTAPGTIPPGGYYRDPNSPPVVYPPGAGTSSGTPIIDPVTGLPVPGTPPFSGNSLIGPSVQPWNRDISKQSGSFENWGLSPDFDPLQYAGRVDPTQVGYTATQGAAQQSADASAIYEGLRSTNPAANAYIDAKINVDNLKREQIILEERKSAMQEFLQDNSVWGGTQTLPEGFGASNKGEIERAHEAIREQIQDAERAMQAARDAAKGSLGRDEWAALEDQIYAIWRPWRDTMQAQVESDRQSWVQDMPGWEPIEDIRQRAADETAAFNTANPGYMDDTDRWNQYSGTGMPYADWTRMQLEQSGSPLPGYMLPGGVFGQAMTDQQAARTASASAPAAAGDPLQLGAYGTSPTMTLALRRKLGLA